MRDRTSSGSDEICVSHRQPGRVASLLSRKNDSFNVRHVGPRPATVIDVASGTAQLWDLRKISLCPQQLNQQLIALAKHFWEIVRLQFCIDAFRNRLNVVFGLGIRAQVSRPLALGRTQMLQHMSDATGASGSVKVEKWTEQRPAQAWAVGDCRVDGLDRGDPALYQTNGFLPKRHLQTVGDMTLDFFVDPDGLLAR